MPKVKKGIKVSPNNPCPVLRALVQQDLLKNNINSIGDVTSAVEKLAKAGDGSPDLPSLAIRAIAVIANGLGPLSVAQTSLNGLRLVGLRNGPLDKKGVGSGILDAHAHINEVELERLKSYASKKKASDGTVELGLDDAELIKMMDDNFERAEGKRRLLDRELMDGEWPVLLKVMGKDGKAGRYLSYTEVRSLFVDRVFPERMMTKLMAP
jgi:hypothetical protein